MWLSAGPMHGPRHSSVSALLPDGRVLVAGGIDQNYNQTTGVEIFNPATGEWTVAASMSVGHTDGTAVTLPSGKVLVIGGRDAWCSETYNPATGQWEAPVPLSFLSVSPTAAALPDGRIIALDVNASTITIILDPGAASWHSGPAKSQYYHDPMLAPLKTGDILLSGGICAELFHAQSGSNTLRINTVAPGSGVNSAAASVTVNAEGFNTGFTFKLVRLGYADITATGITETSTYTFTCTLPITGVQAGVWNAQAVNIDGKTATLASAFTITTASPSVSSLTPSVGYSTAGTVAVTINGGNFLTGSSVTLTMTGKPDIAAVSVTALSPSAITCNLPLANATGGYWNVTVTNPYGQSDTLAGGFSVVAGTMNIITPNASAVLTYNGPSGQIKLEVPAGAFSQTVTLVVSSPTYVPPAGGRFSATGVSMQAVLNSDLQPLRPVTLTLSYLPADIAGLDPARLIIARYDSGRTVWLPLIGCNVDASSRTVSCKTDHFSLFQLVQAAPASNFDDVKYYPNPLRPAKGPLYQKMNFTNLPAGAGIKIFTILGEAVKTLDADANGMATWDGTDGNGRAAASGTYIIRFTGNDTDKIIKVAVQR